MSATKTSDKALSILAFAAYHALSSGESVGQIVVDDGHGHVADPDGLAEMQAAGLIVVEGARARLTDTGLAALDKVVEAVRGAKV